VLLIKSAGQSADKRDMDREEIVEQFQAVEDDGTMHEIILWQTIKEVRTRGGVHYVRGMKRYATSDGLPVNYIDDETFEIVRFSKRVRKV